MAGAGRVRIDAFFLGGTIAMTKSARGPGATPSLSGSQLLAERGATPDAMEVVTHQLSATASANLSLTDVDALAAAIRGAWREGADGAVVVQGTDTLEEVAFALDLLLPPGSPVVITGALRRSDQAGSDGAANLQAALRTAASPRAHGLGVLVVLNDEVHSARSVRKRHTFAADAFSSWPEGPLGRLAEGEVRISRRPATPGLRLSILESATQLAPVVPLLQLGLGSSAAELAWLSAAKFDGLVVAALGGGHAPASCVPTLADAAARAPVVLASRVWGGDVLRSTYGYDGGEIDLIRRGLIPAGLLGPAKARILLQSMLARGASPQTVRAAFGTMD